MRSRLVTAFVLTLLVAPVARRSFADDHAKGGCQGNADAQTIEDYCICLQSEEIILGNNASIYYAYRYTGACADDHPCGNKVDTWLVCASGVLGEENNPQSCDNNECGCPAFRAGRGGMNEPVDPTHKITGNKIPHLKKTGEVEVLNKHLYANFFVNNNESSVRAKVFLVLIPTEDGLPAHIGALAFETKRAGTPSSFDVKHEQIEPMPGSDNSYVAQIGQIRWPLVTVNR